MRWLALLLLICSAAYADESHLELVGGSITYHLSTNPDSIHNAHKISSDGALIANPLIGLRYVHEDLFLYYSVTVFGGENSPGYPMYGAMGSIGITLSNIYLGGIAGGYLQNTAQFLQSHQIPFKLFTIGNSDFVPLLGVELSYRFDLSDNVYLKLNNIFTPVLFNSTFSIGLRL